MYTVPQNGKQQQNLLEQQWLSTGSNWSAQSSVLKAVSSAISIGKDEPGKEEVISTVRKQTNEWVAKYRRDSTFAGRPSYGFGPTRCCTVAKDSYILYRTKCTVCLYREGTSWMEHAWQAIIWMQLEAQDLFRPVTRDTPHEDKLAACIKLQRRCSAMVRTNRTAMWTFPQADLRGGERAGRPLQQLWAHSPAAEEAPGAPAQGAQEAALPITQYC